MITEDEIIKKRMRMMNEKGGNSKVDNELQQKIDENSRKAFGAI